MASWAPMVPYAKTRLTLSEAELGVILLALGAGAMLTMPLTSFFINRFGSRATMLSAVLLLCTSLPFLSLAPTPFFLGVFLFIFGAGVGATDVSMNAQAVVVEQQMRKPIMSSFHGLYSAGGLVGALSVSLLLDQGLDLTLCAIIVAVLGAGLAIWQFNKLLPHADDAKLTGSPLAFPRGPLIWLGALCFIGFLAEGALLDWSAVFLRFSRGFAETNAGMGFAAFSLAMTFGRLTGDRVTHWLGPISTVRWGSILAGIGYLMVVFIPSTWGAMTGFVVIGLGIANVVPLMFSAASRLTNPPPSISIPAITTMGYAGLLAGPAIIGFIGQASSLAIALGCVGFSLFFIAASAHIVKR